MIAQNFLYVYKLFINWYSCLELFCSSCYDICIFKSRRNFMTRSQACRILGVSITADMQEIKKSYRQLMHKVHPDTDVFHTTEYDYNAQEINEAYAFLRKSGAGHSGHTSRTSTSNSSAGSSSHASSGAPKKKRWNAPVNPHAYADLSGNPKKIFLCSSKAFLNAAKRFWNRQNRPVTAGPVSLDATKYRQSLLIF